MYDPRFHDLIVNSLMTVDLQSCIHRYWRISITQSKFKVIENTSLALPNGGLNGSRVRRGHLCMNQDFMTSLSIACGQWTFTVVLIEIGVYNSNNRSSRS